MENEKPPPPPARSAVALRYERGHDAAPRVLATGRGGVADAIVRRARETGVTIREDEALTAALAHLDVGDTIPPELYRAVAEVLAYVYRLDATP
jgi:flagellar biosynthesis protein